MVQITCNSSPLSKPGPLKTGAECRHDQRAAPIKGDLVTISSDAQKHHSELETTKRNVTEELNNSLDFKVSGGVDAIQPDSDNSSEYTTQACEARTGNFNCNAFRGGTPSVPANETSNCDSFSSGSDEEHNGEKSDHIFDHILERIELFQQRKASDASEASSGQTSSQSETVRISENFSSVPFGFQPRAAYDHRKENTDIMGVEYNGRMRQFVILDARGVLTWNRSLVDKKVTRALTYPKYEYKLLTNLIYTRKYNCYFALAKDFSLKMLNKDFEETFSVSADMCSVLFMLFNPVTDELITGGVGGTRVWAFHQVSTPFQELKSMANYKLTLKTALSDVGGSWVKRVELDQHLQHLYCCSDTGLFAYDLQGNLLFQFNRAHNMSITACKYSVGSRFLITSSLDTEVKVWSLMGGLVHTFRGHSRPVTDVLIHPDSSHLVLTSSLDGTVRLWSLDTMDLLYSLMVSVDGVLWMGLTDDKLLYLSTVHNITLWALNTFYHFWSLARNRLQQLSLVAAENKTKRVMAVGEDSSVRVFARSSQKNLSTVLPPPSLSPLETVLSVAYNRAYNVVYLLMSPREVWLYTTRTDPACRVAVWNLTEVQKYCLKNVNRGTADKGTGLSSKPSKGSLVHRTSLNGTGVELVADCHCLCALNSSAMLWTDEGMASPLQHFYLLLGMEDGRILFMDPVVKNVKHMEFRVSKDKVLDVRHDLAHNCLITQCRLKEIISIQVWSLPQLQLQHHLYVTPDLTLLALCGSRLFTGHSDGAVLEHLLRPAEDHGLYSTKAVPTIEELQKEARRPDHSGPVIALDACPRLNIVCSCSGDGSIKVWFGGKTLLTELSVGEGAEGGGIGAACFLNPRGDLLLAHKNHIFTVPHHKVCPSLEVPDLPDNYFDKESAVMEDPRVLYDDRRDDQQFIDLQSYLVPFDIEFSKDFLEGQRKFENLQIEDEDDIDEEDGGAVSEMSHAPTEIYLSPPASPVPLSMVDLTLGSKVTEADLNKQMSKTCRLLARKGKRKRRQSRWSVTKLGGGEMPVFGSSPGPSPSPSLSTVSTPRTRSSLSVSELEAETTDEEAGRAPEDKTGSTAERPEPGEVKPPPPVHVPTAPAQSPSKTKHPEPETTKYGLSHIRLSGPKLSTKLPGVAQRDPVNQQRRGSFAPYRSDSASVNHSQIRKLAASPPPRAKREIKKKWASARRVARRSGVGKKAASVPAAESPGPPDTSKSAEERPETPHLLTAGATREDDEQSLYTRGSTLTGDSDDQTSTLTDTGIPQMWVDLPESLSNGKEGSRLSTPEFDADNNDNISDIKHGVRENTSADPAKMDSHPHNGPISLNVAIPLCETEADEISVQPDVTFQSTTPEVWGVSSVRYHRGQRSHDSALLSPQEKSRLRQRPASSYPGAAHMAAKIEEEVYLPPRPHTAVQADDDDVSKNLSIKYTRNSSVRHLESLFQAALSHYRGRSGTPVDSDQWFRNSGNTFEENWQERMIQRHQLLQLQRHVRARSASSRRQLLEQRQREKRHSLRGHQNCLPHHGYVGEGRPDSSLGVLESVQWANKMSLHRHRPNVTPATLHDRQRLRAEQPFRLRMNKSSTDARRAGDYRHVDLKSCDPRNPKAKRPHSSKSIPNKCSQYVLVSRPQEDQLCVASPLEEQLLAERFPRDYPLSTGGDRNKSAGHWTQEDKLRFTSFLQQISS